MLHEDGEHEENSERSVEEQRPHAFQALQWLHDDDEMVEAMRHETNETAQALEYSSDDNRTYRSSIGSVGY